MTHSTMSKRRRRRLRGKLEALIARAAKSTARAEKAIDEYLAEHEQIMGRIAVKKAAHRRRMDPSWAGRTAEMPEHIRAIAEEGLRQPYEPD